MNGNRLLTYSSIFSSASHSLNSFRRETYRDSEVTTSSTLEVIRDRDGRWVILRTKVLLDSFLDLGVGLWYRHFGDCEGKGSNVLISIESIIYTVERQGQQSPVLVCSKSMS